MTAARLLRRALIPAVLLVAGCQYPTAVTVGRSPVAYTPPPAGAAASGPGRPASVVTPPPAPQVPPAVPPGDRFGAGGNETAAGAPPPKAMPLVVPVYTAPSYGTSGPGGG